jgi:CHAT domain-containing protein
MILDDRLEIILITADAPPLHRSIPLEKGKLNDTISKFMTALRDPKIDPRPQAQQLYQWLIQPIEADLAAAKVTTIIYAPDSQLRYIPLAALHDGKQWLTQRYQFNNITTTDITQLQRTPINKLQVLAGAISDDKQKFYSTKVGTFKGLPNVKAEIDNIAAIVPNTQKFIDQAFDLTTLKSRFNGFKVLHFATHGYFDINSDDKSFILFGGKTTTGDAQIATLDEVGKWTLENVDLVVLSACETGLSDRLDKTPGSFQGTGKEILGLGYQFQQAKVKATISSLWRVDDEGTQILMSAFYQHLQQNNTSVVAALQQAQIDMITNNQAQLTALNQNRWKLTLNTTATTAPRSASQPEWPNTPQPFSHPYYWAPFILTGNGL